MAELPPKTSVDWLRFRTQASPFEALEALRPAFGGAGRYLNLVDTSGRDGFEQGSELCFGMNQVIGRLDYGGASQRGWCRVNVSGRGCEKVESWDAIEGLQDLKRAEIRRLDIALTTWEGQITHDHVLDGHKAGKFKTMGRSPDLRQIISTDERAGRTIYVGSRESTKMLRAYEKGFEMASKTSGLTHVEGYPIEGIYRLELELKAVTASIGWDAIGQRDGYFAGAYPYLAEVLPDVQGQILVPHVHYRERATLKAALGTVRAQFGKTLYTALQCAHGDIGAVWSHIVGKEHSPSLLAAGVLDAEHDL